MMIETGHWWSSYRLPSGYPTPAMATLIKRPSPSSPFIIAVQQARFQLKESI